MVDQVKVEITGGKGGDGAISFLHLKYVPKGGPDGGDGGRGGSVYLHSSDDLNGLGDFRFKKKFKAQDGERGGKSNCSGKSGQDLVLKVPVGTIVRINGKKVYDFVKKDDKFLICRGGEGGMGNAKFKSSVNTTPRQFTPGTFGESFEVELELELIAQVGLVGFPNAGKSTLISKITAANSKIGNYPFTTLEPVLGVMTHKGKTVTIADLPGIIEGASQGKGLGEQFLRHAMRAKAIIYVIELNYLDTKLSFDTLRDELMQFSKLFDKKRKAVILTKSDLVDEAVLAKEMKRFEKEGIEVLTASIQDEKNIEEVKDLILKLTSPRKA